MTKRQAEVKEYRFTGIYGRDKDVVKQRAEEIKHKGYKAVVVTVPDSPYSRGTIGVGYSVYVEEKYVKDEAEKDKIEKEKRDKAAMVVEREIILKRLKEIDAILGT